MSQFGEHVFGPPPPIYTGVISAVRVDGNIVTGDAAKVTPDRLSFDVKVNTTNGVQEIQGLKNKWPVGNRDVDHDGSVMVGKLCLLVYVPSQRVFLPIIQTYADSADCDEIQ